MNKNKIKKLTPIMVMTLKRLSDEPRLRIRFLHGMNQNEVRYHFAGPENQAPACTGRTILISTLNGLLRRDLLTSVGSDWERTTYKLRTAVTDG